MTIDPLSAVVAGFGAVLAYLIWDKKKMDMQIDHMIDQHNKLCMLIEEFINQVEDEFYRIEEEKDD
jgi:hypothetical protein